MATSAQAPGSPPRTPGMATPPRKTIVVVGGGPFGLSTAVHLLLSEESLNVTLIRPDDPKCTAHNDTSRLYRTHASSTGFWAEASAASVKAMEGRGVSLKEVGHVGVALGDSSWARSQSGGIIGVDDKYCVRGDGKDWRHFPQEEGAGYFDVLMWKELMERVFREGGGVIVNGTVTEIKEEANVVAVLCGEGDENGTPLECDAAVLAPGAYVNTLPVFLPGGARWEGLDVALKSQYTCSVLVAAEDVARLPACTVVFGGPTKGAGKNEKAEDSFYYVPPRMEGGEWRAKMVSVYWTSTYSTAVSNPSATRFALCSSLRCSSRAGSRQGFRGGHRQQGQGRNRRMVRARRSKGAPRRARYDVSVEVDLQRS